MNQNIGNVLIGAVAALVLLSMSVFVVDQRQDAIVFQFGEVVSVKTEPGLYFKVPLMQNVRYFDSRILTLDAGEPERFITAEKKNVLVDSFVKWRRSSLIMGWFPCAAALLGSPNAQGKPAQHIHLPLGGRTAPGKARSGRRFLGTNGATLWLWSCLPKPGAPGP